jgi:hypothetical protein
MGFHENPNRLINNNGKKEIWYDPYNPKRSFDIRTKEDLTKDAKFVSCVDRTPPPPQPKNDIEINVDFGFDHDMTVLYQIDSNSSKFLQCEWCGYKTNSLINGLCSYCFRMSSNKNGKQPHVCPICRGIGKVPRGYYCRSLSDTFVSTGGEEECRSCKGTGIVWGD